MKNLIFFINWKKTGSIELIEPLINKEAIIYDNLCCCKYRLVRIEENLKCAFIYCFTAVGARPAINYPETPQYTHDFLALLIQDKQVEILT